MEMLITNLEVHLGGAGCTVYTVYMLVESAANALECLLATHK